MKVKLISYSKPVLEGLDTPTDLVAYCARVSNPSNQINSETAEKLIKYLVKHQHWSPLEMATMCLEIETTRDIARQILRHRSFSFQEFCLSGDTEIYFLPPKYKNFGKYKPSSKMKLSELYDKWHNGAKPIPNKHNNLLSTRIPLKDRIRSMNIKCFDEETQKLTTAHIKEIFYTGKKELYEITLSDGKKIKTTKEHKFLTKEGFDTLESIIGLQLVDSLAVMTKKGVVGVNGILEYRDKDWLLQKKNESLFLGGGIKYICEKYGYNYNTIRKWLKIHNIQYTKKESATTYEIWNKNKFGYSLPPKTEEQRRNHQKSAKKGAECNLWKGGKSSYREKLDTIEAYKFRINKNYICEECGSTGGVLDIHHRIPVSVDPTKQHDIDNWELLCRQCHIDHHKKNDFSGWQSMAARSKVKKSYIAKWAEIVKVECLGLEDTYDIEVDHSSHNYIANGIIVHNSQRYADPTKDLEFVTREARLQDPKNRQNSISEGVDVMLQYEWEKRQQDLIAQVKIQYNWAIANGIAKEQARALLPEGLIMSRMYMSGSLRSWIHYIQLRSGNGTQKEHMEIARECAKVIAEIFPLSTQFISE
jgi:thymidylate synthase (FAD)